MYLQKMTTEELQLELAAQKAREFEAYQLFTRAAASRCGRYVSEFCEAACISKAIRDELRRRKEVMQC